MRTTKLPEELVERIKDYGKLKSLKTGDTLMREGEEPEKVYVLLRGYVNITRKDLLGRDVLIGTAGPGSILGEMGVFMEIERTATVRVISDDAEVLEFDRDEFLEVVSKFKELSLYLLKELAKRVYYLDRKLITTINSKLMLVVGYYLIEKVREKSLYSDEEELSLNVNNASFEIGIDPEKTLTALNNFSKVGLISDLVFVEEKEGYGEDKKSVIAKFKVQPSKIKSYLRTVANV